MEIGSEPFEAAGFQRRESFCSQARHGACVGFRGGDGGSGGVIAPVLIPARYWGSRRAVGRLFFKSLRLLTLAQHTSTYPHWGWPHNVGVCDLIAVM